MSETWPTELRLQQEGTRLALAFESGESFCLTSELLRVESPSAEVRGHGPGQEILVLGKAHVKIKKIEQVGNYAVRLIFDDGHASGIYTWAFLLELGRNAHEREVSYRKRVAEQVS
jgi:DUF971 family protein